MSTVVRQIIFTEAPERWHALAGALGLVAPHPPSPAWGEFHGGGVLAVHRAMPDHPAHTVELNILVEDLDVAEQALVGRDVTRGDMEGVGEMLTVRAASGLIVTVFGGASDAASGEVSVQPIWFQDEVAEARGILEALDLRADIVSDGGGWAQMRAPGGGSVGLHSTSGRSEGEGQGFGLSFEAHGDLDALAVRLTDAGFTASVIDEAYGRTIRVTEPDVWINGVQDDLYGYRRTT